MFLIAEETGIVAVRIQADQPDRPAECRIRITVPVKSPENPGIPDLSPASKQDPIMGMVLPAAAREKTTDFYRRSEENQMKGIALAVPFHVNRKLPGDAFLQVDGKKGQCYI